MCVIHAISLNQNTDAKLLLFTTILQGFIIIVINQKFRQHNVCTLTK